MSQFEHYCETCGQGAHMFTTEGRCPLCNHSTLRYVQKKKYVEKIEKLGINELVDN